MLFSLHQPKFNQREAVFFVAWARGLLLYGLLPLGRVIMTTCRILVVVFLMVGLMVNSVFAEEKSELMATLLHAVESQEDELQAELTGTYANWLRTTLNTSSQVFVSVKTLPIEASPGCKKLFATLFLPDLHWQLEGATQYFQFYFKLNLCRDGSAPSPP